MSNIDDEQNPINWLVGQPVHATEIGGERFIPTETLSEKIDALLASANDGIPDARHISKRTLLNVAERALFRTLGVSDVEQRLFTVTRELDDFINMAINGHQPVVASAHTDLLPIGHPLSTRSEDVSERTRLLLASEWLAADPRLSDEFRPLVASACLTSPGSVERNYVVTRLESADPNDVPRDVVMAVVAVGNPFSGGNSFLERSARAKLQRRDRRGRFAWMNGGARSFIEDAKGFIHSVVGKFVGIGKDSDTFDVEFINDPVMGTGIFNMPTQSVVGVKAILRSFGKLFKTKSPESATYARDYAINHKNLKRVACPTGWKLDPNGVSKVSRHKKQFLADDGYVVREYASTNDIPDFDAKKAEGVEVKGIGENGAIDPKYPVYELFTNPLGARDKEKWDSDANQFIGYYQSWGDIQSSAQKADKKAYKAVDARTPKPMWGDVPEGDFPQGTFVQDAPADDKTPFSTYLSKNNVDGLGGYTVRRFQPEKHGDVKADMERNVGNGASVRGFESGSSKIDPDEPIFEVTRQPAKDEEGIKPEVIGYAQDWEDVQAMAESSESTMPRMGRTQNDRARAVKKFKKEHDLDYVQDADVVIPEDFKQDEKGKLTFTPEDPNASRAEITENIRGEFVVEIFDNAEKQDSRDASYQRNYDSKEEALGSASETLTEENGIKAPSASEREEKMLEERRGLGLFKPVDDKPSEDFPEQNKEPIAILPENAGTPQAPPLPNVGQSQFKEPNPAKPKSGRKQVPTFVAPDNIDHVYEDQSEYSNGFAPINISQSNKGIAPTPDQASEFKRWEDECVEREKVVKKRVLDRMVEKYGPDFSKIFLKYNTEFVRSGSHENAIRARLHEWMQGEWEKVRKSKEREIADQAKRDVLSGAVEVPQGWTKGQFIEEITNERMYEARANFFKLGVARAYAEANGQKDIVELFDKGREFQTKKNEALTFLQGMELDLSVASQEEYRKFLEENGVEMYDGDGSDIFDFDSRLTASESKEVLGFFGKKKAKYTTAEVNQGEDAAAEAAARAAVASALKRYPKWMIERLKETLANTPSGKLRIQLDYLHHSNLRPGRGFFDIIRDPKNAGHGDFIIRLSANNNGSNHGLIPYEETAAHEVGHALEAALPELRNMEWALLMGHTTRMSQNGAQLIEAPMNMSLNPREPEYTLPDSFRNLYSARTYGDPNPLAFHEVFTMSQERMVGGGGMIITNQSILDRVEAGDMTADEALFGDSATAVSLGFMIDGKDSDLELHKKQTEDGIVFEQTSEEAIARKPPVGFTDASYEVAEQEHSGKTEIAREVASRIVDVSSSKTIAMDGMSETKRHVGEYSANGKKYELHLVEKVTISADGRRKIVGSTIDITDGYSDIGDMRYSEASSRLTTQGTRIWNEDELPRWYSRDDYDTSKPFSTISYIEVDDDHQRIGLGTAMLEFARRHSEAPIHHSYDLSDKGVRFAQAVRAPAPDSVPDISEEEFPEPPKVVNPKEISDDEVSQLISDSPVSEKTLKRKRGDRGIGSLARHGYKDNEFVGEPTLDADGDAIYEKLVDRAVSGGMPRKDARELAIEQVTKIRDFIQRKNDKSRVGHLVDAMSKAPEGAPDEVVKERARWRRSWDANSKTVKRAISSALTNGRVVEPIDGDKLLRVIEGREKFSGKGFLANDFTTGRAMVHTNFVAAHNANQDMRDILSVRNARHENAVKVVFKDKVKDRSTYTAGDSSESGAIPQPMSSTDEDSMIMAGLLSNNNGSLVSMAGRGAPTSNKRLVETQTQGNLSLNDVDAIYVSGDEQVSKLRELIGNDYPAIEIVNIDQNTEITPDFAIRKLDAPSQVLIDEDFPDTTKPMDSSAKARAVRERITTDSEPVAGNVRTLSDGDTYTPRTIQGSYMLNDGTIVSLEYNEVLITNPDGEHSGGVTSVFVFSEDGEELGVLEVMAVDSEVDENGKTYWDTTHIDKVAHPEMGNRSDSPAAGIAWINVKGDVQREGIGTAMLEFARMHYPYPIYHSDNLTYNGRAFATAVKAPDAEAPVEDFPPITADAPSNLESTKKISELLDTGGSTQERLNADTDYIHDSVNAAGITDEEITYVSLTAGAYNLKEEELLPWEGKRSPGSIRLMGSQRDLGYYLDVAESNGRQYKSPNADIIKNFNKKYGEEGYKFGYREKAGLTYEQAKEFLAEVNSSESLPNAFMYADALQGDNPKSFARQYIRDYFNSWASSSESMHWQDAVKEEFNLEGTLSHNTTDPASLARVYERDKGVKYAQLRKKIDMAVVRAKYETTQKLLKDNGITGTVTLYKGVSGSEERWGITDPTKVVDSVPIKGNPLNSWTDDKGVAMYFSSTVLKAEIPVERIFGTRANGLGFAGKNGQGVDEREIVVMGGGEMSGSVARIRGLPEESRAAFSPSAGDQEEFPEAPKTNSSGTTINVPANVDDEEPEQDATPEAGDKAREVRKFAEEVEPKITEDVVAITQGVGGFLKGLANRLKTRKSLARKIDKDSKDFDGDRGEAAARITDAVRYTMVVNTKKYVQAIKDARERFIALGYKVEKEKNFWKSDEYKGYAFKLVSPDGYPVEFQIHTDESFEIKADLHGLYEQWRKLDPKSLEARNLHTKLKALASQIPVPEDESLFDIGNLINYEPDKKLKKYVGEGLD